VASGTGPEEVGPVVVGSDCEVVDAPDATALVGIVNGIAGWTVKDTAAQLLPEGGLGGEGGGRARGEGGGRASGGVGEF